MMVITEGGNRALAFFGVHLEGGESGAGNFWREESRSLSRSRECSIGEGGFKAAGDSSHELGDWA